MKSITKFTKPIAIVLILCTLFSFGVYAEETEPEIEPDIEEYSNTLYILSDFSIVNGTAKMYAYFRPQSSSCTVEVHMQLEKKWLFWWFDVDDGEFSDTVSGSYTSVQHELPLSSTGDYRATITVTVSGPYGSDDYYENSHTAEY